MAPKHKGKTQKKSKAAASTSSGPRRSITIGELLNSTSPEPRPSSGPRPPSGPRPSPDPRSSSGPRRSITIAELLNSSSSPKGKSKSPAAQTTTTTRKRPSLAETAVEQQPASVAAEPAKKRRKVAPKPKPKQKQKPSINKRPTQPLAIYVMGTGEAGELGLGPEVWESSRPSLNRYLDSSDVASKFRIVQLSCGGMHTVALTDDNKIVTWGSNDNHALGRNTDWDGVPKGSGDNDHDQCDELNPYESTPTAISEACFPDGTQFTQVAAGDNCSFALTADGLVYGWGTFRDLSGNTRFGYNADDELIQCQETPRLVPKLEKIIQIACGADHALALEKGGTVWGWGSHERNQLGRKLRARHTESLIPRRVPVCRGRVTYIASGEYHAFAVDGTGNVWTWGLNSFGEAGSDPEHAGEDDCLLPVPMKIAELKGENITRLDGGTHHSAALSASGDVFVWGRMDGGQLGVDLSADQLDDESLVRRDDRGQPRICLRPTKVPHMGPVAHVACGTDHTLFVGRDGSVFASGMGVSGQLGLGTEEEEVSVAEKVEIADGAKMVWADAGAQFSMLGGARV